MTSFSWSQKRQMRRPPTPIKAEAFAVPNPEPEDEVAAVDAEYRAAALKFQEASREMGRLKAKKRRLLLRLERESPVDMTKIWKVPKP